MADDLDDAVVEFTTLVGFRAHARVLCAEDSEAPEDRPMLAEVIGPAHPDDQPDRATPYPEEPDSYAVHAEQFAGSAIPAGDECTYLPEPDGDRVELVDESEIWEAGQYILESEDPERYEELEHHD